MNTVLIFSTSVGRARTEMLKGVHEFARSTDWRIQVLEFDGSPFPIKDLLSFWTPIGCIVEGSGAGVTAATIPHKAFGRTPVVYLGCEAALTPANATRVVHDATATANAAARELISLDFKNFAFVGAKGKAWSERREKAFLTALKINGRIAASIDFASSPNSRYGKEITRLKNWLLALPKPCGLMAANDALAATILSLCKMAGISVPDDIAVVGVDDNESVCENTSPTLSSVRPDFVQGGRFAARLLARKLCGGREIQRESVFAASGIVRRSSTRIQRRKDSEVSAALDRIWSPTGPLMTAKEVLSAFSCSRRNAEIRFRQTTGTSVLKELAAARMHRAKTLLAETALSVAEIAAQCGYKFPAHFRNAFRMETGQNPLSWRKH